MNTVQVELKECFHDPLLDVMRFLNEVVADYPAAISFAPGRPAAALLDVDRHLPALATYVAHTARQRRVPLATVSTELAQYSRTNGIIAPLIAEQLAQDEDVHVDPEAIIVTVGAQEAMAIVVAALFDPRRDVLLVCDPTYVGMAAFARLLDVPVVPVPSDDGGPDPDVVEEMIQGASRVGRVRALYVIPDFSNPLGTSLSMSRRTGLLEVCRRYGVLVVEDNPYGMFAYDHVRMPTLKSLDRSSQVLYIGSFAKTLCPGLRIGYLVADQRVRGTAGFLADALSRVKGLITVNTPPVLQAMAGGLLVEAGGTLQSRVAAKRARYKLHRDAMQEALEVEFHGVPEVRASRPAGGFFLTLTLPFAFGLPELRACAAGYGVIVTPMGFFCIGHERPNQVRLSFSSVDPEEIASGVGRFAAYVRDRMNRPEHPQGVRPAIAERPVQWRPVSH